MKIRKQPFVNHVASIYNNQSVQMQKPFLGIPQKLKCIYKDNLFKIEQVKFNMDTSHMTKQQFNKMLISNMAPSETFQVLH